MRRAACAPLFEDLFLLYDAERFGREAELPPSPGTLPFRVLEGRLLDTLYARPSPTRASLRGGLWRYEGQAYGYTFCFQPNAVSLIERAAAALGLPFDVAMLGLVACAQAHADERELVEFTTYAPMRDGVAESTMMGLFSDWRDFYVGVDFDMATVLGTLLQVYHTIQHRHWTPFNALRKPERTVMNMQPLDMQRRSHFAHLGENLWHGGDSWRDGPPRRQDRMDWGRQPLTFNLEQQDESTWWLLVDIGATARPPAWMRRFSLALEQALDDLFVDPLARVHRPLLHSGAWC